MEHEHVKLVINSNNERLLINGIIKHYDRMARVRGTVAGQLSDKLYTYFIDKVEKRKKIQGIMHYYLDKKDVRIGKC